MRSSQHSLIGVLLMLFSSRMISEVVQPFWAALQRGEFITGAAESVGSYRVQGRRWIVAAGGVRPRRGRDLQGRYLSFSEVRRSRWAGRPASRCGASRGGWGARPRRSHASWRATPIAAGIGRRRRMRRRGSVSSQAGQAGRQPAVARDRAARLGAQVLSGADRGPAATGVSR